MSKKWRFSSVVVTGVMLAGCAAVLGIDDVSYLLPADADAGADAAAPSDPDGACGAECQTPIPFPYATDNRPTAIAVTSEALYVGHYSGDGGVVRFELDGGNPTVLARDWTSYFATARGRLYYTTWEPGSLRSMALDGGDIRTEATLDAVFGLLLREEKGHLIAYVGRRSDAWQGIWAVDLDSDGGVRPIEPRNSPGQIATDGARIFWANTNNLGVWTYDPSRAVATQLSTTAAEPFGVAALGEYVYFTERASPNPRISRVRIDGGSSELVATLGPGTTPKDLIVSDGFLWVAAGTDIYRVSPGVDGGAPRSVASGFGAAEQIVADERFIYWTDKSGRVQKLRKPLD